MSFEMKLALRYFRARRKTLARFTSCVAVVGIAAGVASLIIANALARGFADEMRDKILANTAHVSVFSNDGAEIFDWREIKTNLEKLENVKAVSATAYESAVLVGEKTTTNYAVLRTVESSEHSITGEDASKNNEQQTANGEQQSKGENEAIGISIGKELAGKANLKRGDATEIITIEDEIAPRASKVFVREIFQTGLYEYDASWIRLSPDDYARLKNKANFTPTILSVSVEDIYKADETARQIRQILGENYKVLDWQEANQPLFAALSLERRVALAIISLIIFIAALNITTTLALLVGERRLDIAVLRTCGARTRSLLVIFLLEGLFLGFLGICGGVILGLLACFLGNHFKIINLSKEVYSLNYVPFHPEFESVLLIVSIAFTLCLAATVYPAFKASRIKPLENLRAQ